ncbi:hypothetical protein JYQ62_16095 [Nostoc sp. UHCC 0702]|nr:hypothetical protein JYQ62_16095 [Nostoc sp. UHCC 0702]
MSPILCTDDFGDEDSQSIIPIGRCPQCADGELFLDPDEEPEFQVICCDSCDYAIDPRKIEFIVGE